MTGAAPGAIMRNMSEEITTQRRTGKSGGIVTGVIVLGSFVAVVGWYLTTNRTGMAVDTSGFDLSSAPKSQTPAPTYSGPASAEPASSLTMLRGDAGVRIVSPGTNAAAPGAKPAADTPEAKKENAHASFKDMARKHEMEVRRFAAKMVKKYPLLEQYRKDWMAHPDLKKLNDDYARDKDPVAFLNGLMKAPSLGPMIKQYAGKREIISFVTEGMREAPGELTSSAADVLSTDGAIKNLVANVAGAVGLPSSITGMISGSGDPSKIDQNKVATQMLQNNPDIQKALQGQNGQQAAPPVSLQGR